MDSFSPGLVFAAFLSACASSASLAKAQTSEPIVMEGLCSYSDRLAPLLDEGHVFVDCDRLEIRRSAGQATLKFAFPARLSWVEFRGTFREKDRFEISAIRLRSERDWVEAEGQCRFVSEGNAYSSVTCLSTDGPRFFVANFARVL